MGLIIWRNIILGNRECHINYAGGIFYDLKQKIGMLLKKCYLRIYFVQFILCVPTPVLKVTFEKLFYNVISTTMHFQMPACFLL